MKVNDTGIVLQVYDDVLSAETLAVSGYGSNISRLVMVWDGSTSLRVFGVKGENLTYQMGDVVLIGSLTFGSPVSSSYCSDRKLAISNFIISNACPSRTMRVREVKVYHSIP